MIPVELILVSVLNEPRLHLFNFSFTFSLLVKWLPSVL